MRDNQGREIIAQPTTMRLAFLEAKGPFRSPGVVAMVTDSLLRMQGARRKAPAWTVTRKGGR